MDFGGRGDAFTDVLAHAALCGLMRGCAGVWVRESRMGGGRGFDILCAPGGPCDNVTSSCGPPC